MVDVAEHVHHDDPEQGHPDVRTRLAGASYFFLGNGIIQAAVQFAPGGEGTPLGLLVMDPERLRTKREALTQDATRGLERTIVDIVTPAGILAPSAGSLSVVWDRSAAEPTVEARWEAADLHVVERFSCAPGRPTLVRLVEIENRGGATVTVSVRTGGGTTAVGEAIGIEAGGRARLGLAYDLDADANTVSVRVDPDQADTARSAIAPYRTDTARSAPRPGSGLANAPYRTDTARSAIAPYRTDTARSAIAPYRTETEIAFDHPLLDRFFHAARCQLPAAVSSSGRLDGGIWQYNREWVRDQAMVALALTQLGRRDLAATMLRRLLREFVTEEGATVDSSEVRGRDDVELDQNGVLLWVLAQHAWWAGDPALVSDLWPRVRALAEYPLRPEFRHDASGLLVGCREYWERHRAHGIEPGFELTYQVFVSIGLDSAADLASALGHEADEQRWRAASQALRESVRYHPTYALHDARGFIKRRALDGSIQEEIRPQPGSGVPPGVPLAGAGAHLLNPDTCAVLPIAFGFVGPGSPLAQATLAHVERLWNQAWTGGGYGRYDVSSEPDSPGPWPFASLFVARAAIENGRSERFWRILRWMDTVPGAAAGSWFEFYGPRPSPPCPQVGVIPWTWAELVLLFVSHVLGVRPGPDTIRVRPRLPAGLDRVTASLPVGSGWIHLKVIAEKDAPYREAILDRPNGPMTLELAVPALP